MIILGVDPAIQITGYALLELTGNKYQVLDYGCIETKSKDDFSRRLKIIHDGLSQVINHYHPQTFAIEEVIYLQNIQIAIRLGHVRGVALLAAVNNEVPIFEYSPREIKLAVTGNGGASKQQIQKTLQQILNINQSITSYDITDAMAVAICHCHRSTTARRVTQ
jgi:crossover junction endodeoxyribonuclease RuvC